MSLNGAFAHMCTHVHKGTWVQAQTHGYNDERKIFLAAWESKYGLTAQAFFITDAAELGEWMAKHPEYSQDQKISLANAIADFKGLKKKDKVVFTSSVQAHGSGDKGFDA